MQDKEAEKAFFDTFARSHSYDVFDARGYRRLVGEFVKLVKPEKGERLLDVGCGTGAFVRQLKDLGLCVKGIDLSFNCVSLAQAESGLSSWMVGDAEHLPFADNEFDILTFSGILHHLPNPGKAMAESLRVLKAGGRVFGYDPNGRNPAMWLFRSPTSPFGSRKGWTVNERLLFAKELERGLVESGFSDVSCSAISGVSYKYVESTLVKRLLGFYNFMDTCLQMTPFESRFGAFLISFARKPSDEAR